MKDNKRKEKRKRKTKRHVSNHHSVQPINHIIRLILRVLLRCPMLFSSLSRPIICFLSSPKLFSHSLLRRPYSSPADLYIKTNEAYLNKLNDGASPPFLYPLSNPPTRSHAKASPQVSLSLSCLAWKRRMPSAGSFYPI